MRVDDEPLRSAERLAVAARTCARRVPRSAFMFSPVCGFPFDGEGACVPGVLKQTVSPVFGIAPRELRGRRRYRAQPASPTPPPRPIEGPSSYCPSGSSIAIRIVNACCQQPASRTSRSRVPPTRSASPSTSGCGVAIRAPLTQVPLVEPRSFDPRSLFDDGHDRVPARDLLVLDPDPGGVVAADRDRDRARQRKLAARTDRQARPAGHRRT